MRHEIDVTELVNKMPLKVKRELMKLIRQASKVADESEIEHIQAFVEQYHEDSQIDRMVANVASQVIRRVGRTLTDAVKKTDGDGLCGVKAGYMVLECLKKEQEDLLGALQKIEAEEKDHQCNH